MALNKAHHLYVAIIDVRLIHLLKHGGSDDDVLDCIQQNSKMYHSVKTKASQEEFEHLCATVKGFGYFRKLVAFFEQQKKSGACAPLLMDYSLTLSFGTRN